MRFESIHPESAVRVLAGTFVLIGTALAWLVSPWWLLLPAFVGANLIQSVFTGFCPALIVLGLLKVRHMRSALSPARRLPATEVRQRVQSANAVLVDVREPIEWKTGVIEGAILLPLSDLTGPRQRWQTFLRENSDREIVCYCAAGGRAGTAASILIGDGFKAANGGGFSELQAAGWPTTKPVV